VFVVEGAVFVREAITAGLRVEAIYVGPGAPDDLAAHGVPVVEVDAGVIEKVATTVTPQPVVAVVRACDVPLASLERASFVVACAGVADPGNAGTILRTAEAAGADAVVFTPGSVDVYNPKVVRASAGALFHVPVVVGAPLAQVREVLGLPLLGTAASGGLRYTDAPLTQPFAVVLGNEAHGLDAADHALLDAVVTIPHVGRAESLNVAMAAAVLCFEAARQRGVGRP
jgi:RNA methyltransferase, TrmH family